MEINEQPAWPDRRRIFTGGETHERWYLVKVNSPDFPRIQRGGRYVCGINSGARNY